MISKAVLGSSFSPLLVVMMPLAAVTAVALLTVLFAVSWMSAVHGLLARLDSRAGIGRRFPASERGGRRRH